MYWHKNNFLVKKLYPSFLWNKPTHTKEIYLTFDDGPIPEVTEWVLEQLAAYQAKATFFCVGDNIRKHPFVFTKVKQGGHSIGNHTYNHLNGWKTPVSDYFTNVQACQQVAGIPVHLFRPPYGKITRKQAAHIQQTHQIVMWDVLSGDFDQQLPAQVCLRKSIQHTENGSIVVFHDSIKAWKNLKEVLPAYLAHFSALGYTFQSL
ncbi:polysaccharide deacetylase family protein [Rhodocytophaga rosea]|uniref:Polysaccharide deacetylase family protein n=1 Tax=Rhodocytophaga rosea TaxID=2704465 RepID=A0A6C0GFA4_9BACT|nr:polysaccharide deacetylase family protein [Rhodocytophaga rosea]QHT66484.1 polysaccharide deacetylase family protein [Rhodocytophaga rosea]